MMTNIEKCEKIQRLEVAYRNTIELLESQPKTSDYHLGSDIAKSWTIVTAAYSGLEQAIK